MINIAICNEDKTIANIIEQMLYRIAPEENAIINCKVFFDVFTLITNIKQGIYYDIIYVEIETQIINGINIAKMINNMNICTQIIFISKNEKISKKLFDTSSFQLLIVPLDAKSFYTVFKFAFNKIQQKRGYFSYTYNKSFFKIPLNCISYFESKGRIIHIHTNQNINNYKNNFNQSENRFYGKLNEVEKNLSCNNLQFLRIHQSYLLNFDYIKCINFTEAQLLDGSILQISENKQKRVLNMFCSLVGNDYVKKSL